MKNNRPDIHCSHMCKVVARMYGAGSVKLIYLCNGLCHVARSSMETAYELVAKRTN